MTHKKRGFVQTSSLTVSMTVQFLINPNFEERHFMKISPSGFVLYPTDYLTRKLNRKRSVFPSSQALLKALYLATFEVTKKWTMPIRNRGQVYGELAIMYEDRLPE